LHYSTRYAYVYWYEHQNSKYFWHGPLRYGIALDSKFGQTNRISYILHLKLVYFKFQEVTNFTNSYKNSVSVVSRVCTRLLIQLLNDSPIDRFRLQFGVSYASTSLDLSLDLSSPKGQHDRSRRVEKHGAARRAESSHP
jgi:hypothetical protein